MKIGAVLLMLCASMAAQDSNDDVVQAWFGQPLTRKEAAFCQSAKHVNVFVRVRNDGTTAFDNDGNRKISAGVRYPTLAPAYIGQVERLLRSEGYCVYHAVIFENPQVMEQPSWVPGAAAPGTPQAALLHIDTSMALSPTEVSTELEAEPPYVLVNFHAVVGYHMEALSMTARNRWLSLVPEIVGSSLFDNGRSTTPPERLITFIDWVANRIPAVKTKLMFEGRELPKAASCQEVIDKPEVDATLAAARQNWLKSTEAACRVSSVYFDQDGAMKKCGAK
jgi:hypothetical protein